VHNIARLLRAGPIAWGVLRDRGISYFKYLLVGYLLPAVALRHPVAPSIEGIENVVFNGFTMGTPITNLAQANNTLSLMDNFSKVQGTHTLKAGGYFSYEQVNVNPNATFNGSFQFTGSETGSDFADFLIGVGSTYNQAQSQTYYGRHKYAAAFFEDSWRARTNLTLNYGVRWELMQYWSEKYNQIPTFVLGQQSKVYPTAPTSLVYPTDPGVPPTLVPQRYRLAPRVGVAYSPNRSDGLLGKILGGPGKTSIRAGYGKSAKIAARKSRSASARLNRRSICPRVASMSGEYWTPDGHAVTHAMHPRQASK